jgi:L-asparaginase II
LHKFAIHLHDWVFSEHPGAFLNCKTARDLAKFLATQSSDFLVVKDLANATKHMHINSGQVLVHAGASTVQSTGYGEGGYGMGVLTVVDRAFASKQWQEM